jgi:hypothetical protein
MPGACSQWNDLQVVGDRSSNLSREKHLSSSHIQTCSEDYSASCSAYRYGELEYHSYSLHDTMLTLVGISPLLSPWCNGQNISVTLSMVQCSSWPGYFRYSLLQWSPWPEYFRYSLHDTTLPLASSFIFSRSRDPCLYRISMSVATFTKTLLPLEPYSDQEQTKNRRPRSAEHVARTGRKE